MGAADEAYDRLHGLDGHVQTPCICPPTFCFGVPGDSDDNPQICRACMALDSEEACLRETSCDHEWLDRPESDTRVCEMCREER